MWVIRAILVALIIVCIIAFAFYNIGTENNVDVNLIFNQYIDVPMITVVFFSFVIGIVVSLLLFISIYIKLSVQLRSAKKQVKALEGEVTVLRNRPIEESADLLKNTDSEKSETISHFKRSEL